ncbi:MAG: response regulator [Oscillatoriophycideae cyanobacterium NC_groundwater_1537_Pr4_S-0.65um_50_18]|nr:response regulator [Oscillatoriophycideae cyanobacterium NC_groundwater_1537_Pr4_S-0.65um_50_18]
MYKILIIDDNPNICLITKIILKDIAGWEPVIAASGEEGLASAQGEQPDAILLDVEMPGMDGMMVLKQLRVNPETQFIPVILFTSKKIGAEAVAQLPITGVISKPFDTNELINQIRLLLNWHE